MFRRSSIKRTGYMDTKTIKQGVFGSKTAWKRQHFNIKGDKLIVSEKEGAEPTKTVELTADIVLQLLPAPGGKGGDDLRLIVITTSRTSIEVLATSAADAQRWMASLQGQRTKAIKEKNANPSKSKNGGSGVKLVTGGDDEAKQEKKILGARVELNITVTKSKKSEPLGLRLTGGSGEGADPSRPHIVVFWTIKDSLSAKADLRKGDVIKSVNKTAVKGMPVDDVSYLLSNAASAVNFVVLRKKGEPAKRKKSLDKAPETPKKKKSTKEGKKKSKKSKKKKSKKGKEEKKEVEVPREKTLQEKKDDEEEVFGFGAAEDPVPVVVEAPKPVDEGRAARLAAMKEKREMKRRASLKEVDEALSYLSIIDNLSED